MKADNLVLVILFSVLLWGCAAQKEITSKGDEVELKLRSGKTFKGEMVGMADTTVIFSLKENSTSLYTVKKDDIESITVNGYSNSSWIFPVILLQVLPPIILAITASSVSGAQLKPGFFLFFIPAIVTAMIFGSSDVEPPVWDLWKSLDPIESMNKYTRYPDGLNETKLELLLLRMSSNTLEVLQ